MLYKKLKKNTDRGFTRIVDFRLTKMWNIFAGRKSRFSPSRKFTTGFTLIELLVVVAIFAIISGVALWNYNRFSSNLVVTNLAYQAAIEVRQAQVYGISVKKVKNSTGGEADFNSAYGVWFEKTNMQKFTLFADIIGNGDNEFTDSKEKEEDVVLNGANNIKKFCVISSTKGTFCSDVGLLDALSIVFKRPNPNAYIYGFLGNISSYTGVYGNDPKVEFDSAEIQFTSGRGDKVARMTVTNTGQISVDSCNSAPTNHQCK